MGIMLELFQRFPDQPIMAGIVFTQPCFATAGPGPSAIAQGVVLVVAHDDAGGAVLHHVAHQVQGLTDSRPSINDIADENGLPAGVLIDPVHLAVAHLVQQSGQCIGATVNITDDVVTAAAALCIGCHI